MRSRPSPAWSAALLLSGVALSACGHVTDISAVPDSPVQLSPVPGTGLQSVVLSEASLARLGIRTTPVAPAPDAPAGQLHVPYSSIVYDEQGGTWVFAPTAPRRYLRHQVTVDYIAGGVAVLSRGPAAGTPVVTEGSQELLGAEYGISGEG